MDYKIIYSNRKTVSLGVSDNLELIVRAPHLFPKKEIEKIVSSHKNWIQKALAEQKDRQSRFDLSEEEKKVLRQKAKEYLPERVEYFSTLLGVKCNGVKITSAKKRFGSCSGKNNICFSLYLMQFPDEAIDYVVVHELSHIVHKNHSKEFYKFLAKYMPDYKNRQKLLKKKIK